MKLCAMQTGRQLGITGKAFHATQGAQQAHYVVSLRHQGLRCRAAYGAGGA